MIIIEISIVLILAVIMGLTDYFGHKISGLAGNQRDNLLSLSSGLLISLVFLIFIPDLATNEFSELIFFFLLVGFLAFHFIEKYIYRHVTNKSKLLEELKIVHIIGFGLDNFLIGIIIATFIELEITIILNLAIPLFLQMLTSSFSLDSIDIRLNDKISKVLLSFLPIIGAVVGLILEFEEFITNFSIALIIGILLYIIIRDVIPQGNKGSVFMFLMGNLITLSLWIVRIFF